MALYNTRILTGPGGVQVRAIGLYHKENVIIQKMCSMGEWLHYSYIKLVSVVLPLLSSIFYLLIYHRLFPGIEGVNYSCNLYRNKA